MYLVDTDILSETEKPRPNPRVVAWLEAHESVIFVSTLTLGEIHRGIELLASGHKKQAFRKWFDAVRKTFGDTILPFDEAVALRWGTLTADLRKSGRTMPGIDSLLAATALQHDLTLVTGNAKDFHAPRLKVLNPK